MIRFLRKLARDKRGTSVIELAMVTPIFAGLLIGMVDLSRAYSAKLQLEQAAQRSIERVQQYQTMTSTYATLYTEAADAAGVPVGDVTVDPWAECNAVRQASYNTVCPIGQTKSAYITVSIDKAFTPLFGTRYFPGANPNGTYTLTGEAGLRTQ